jgi:hypothetical protein
VVLAVTTTMVVVVVDIVAVDAGGDVLAGVEPRGRDGASRHWTRRRSTSARVTRKDSSM